MLRKRTVDGSPDRRKGLNPQSNRMSPMGLWNPRPAPIPSQVETAQAVGRGVDIADVVEDDSAAKARPSTRPISSTVTGTAIG